MRWWWMALGWAAEPDIVVPDDVGVAAPAIQYSGGFSQKGTDKAGEDASVTIHNPVGTTVVRCTDTEVIEARVAYNLEGSAEGPLSTYGKSVKLAVTGSGSAHSVKMLVGSKPPAVTGGKIELVVNVPPKAKLKVTSDKDWIQVTGCGGTVTASAGANGAFVGGNLSSFQVSAATGDVKVKLEGDGLVRAASSIKAPKGGITLIMAMSQDLQVDARGGSIVFAQNVMGSVGSTAVNGAIGAGGPLLTLQADGEINVKSL